MTPVQCLSSVHGEKVRASLTGNKHCRRNREEVGCSRSPGQGDLDLDLTPRLPWPPQVQRTSELPPGGGEKLEEGQLAARPSLAWKAAAHPAAGPDRGQPGPERDRQVPLRKQVTSRMQRFIRPVECDGA